MPSNTFGGGPYFAKAKSGSPIVNNGGTVLYGGNINTNLNNVTQALGISVVGYRSGANGSILPPPFVPTAGTYGLRCTTNARSGDYGKITAGRYVMIRFTNFIAGNASTLLNSGAADFGRLPYPGSINNRIRTQRILMNGGWVYVTGKLFLGYGRVDFGDPINVEAFPTRAIPGRILFRTSGPSYTAQNYQSRND
jgi:hypothetical protein